MPKELVHLSTTLISNWQDCPSRAWRNYARRLILGDDNEGTDPTRFGTAVHGTMQWAHELVMRDEPFSEADVLAKFSEQFQQSNCSNFEYYSLGNDKISDFLTRSIHARNGVTVATELAFVYCLETKELFIDYGDGEIDIFAIAQVMRERGHTPIISKIDRIDRIGANVYEVFDYKTNILPFTRDYIETNIQLGIYDLVVRVLYPDATEVVCTFDMVRHGRFSVTFQQPFRDMLVGYLQTLHRQILLADVLEERLNKYCRWCEIRANCKVYQKALVSPLPPILVEGIDTPEGLAALRVEFERVSDLLKAVEERKKELQGMIMSGIERVAFGEPLPAGEKEFYLQPNPRYEYDRKKVWGVLQEAQATVFYPEVAGGISKASMDKFLKGHPEFAAKLTPLMEKKMVSPTIKTRAIKGASTFKEDPIDVGE